MTNATKLAMLAMTGALGATGAATDAHAAKGDMEKCYGVVEAGHNQCGNVAHSCKAGDNTCATEKHGCAGQATQDGDPGEWIMVPKGLCDKLVNGSTEPNIPEELLKKG